MNAPRQSSIPLYCDNQNKIVEQRCLNSVLARRPMKREIQLNRVEVFVKRSATYFITDNMKVLHGAPGTLLELLCERGIGNLNLVEEKLLKVGPD